MPDQVTIPVDEAQPTSGRCAWCDGPAFTQLELERTRYTKAANGVRVVKRNPVVAWACAAHVLSLQFRGEQ